MTEHLDADLTDDVATMDLLGDEAHAPARTVPLARRLAVGGIGGVLLSVVAIGLLHVLPASRVLNPLSSTISEYALLPNGWLFNVGVVVLALSSAAILLALTVRRMVAGRSWGAAMMSVWCVGLVGLIVFHKQVIGIDSSFLGRIHWTWTLIAFFSLPIGTCLTCWQHRTLGRWPRWAIRLSMVAGAWFVVLTVQTVISATTPIKAYVVVGLVERALSLTEMVVVVVLGLWVLHDTGPHVVTSNDPA